MKALIASPIDFGIVVEQPRIDVARGQLRRDARACQQIYGRPQQQNRFAVAVLVFQKLQGVSALR